MSLFGIQIAARSKVAEDKANDILKAAIQFKEGAITAEELINFSYSRTMEFYEHPVVAPTMEKELDN